MIQSDWNKVFRGALSELLSLPIEAVLKQGQNEGLATHNSFCTYFLESCAQSYDIYQGNDSTTAWYDLAYIVSVYDKKASDRAQQLMFKLHLQHSKDILNPAGLKYKDASIITNFVEYINDIGYSRTDIRIELAAEYSEEFKEYISKIQYGFFTDPEDKSWHRV